MYYLTDEQKGLGLPSSDHLGLRRDCCVGEGRAGDRVGGATLRAFHTHLAAADPGVKLPSFQCFRHRFLPKLLSLLHCCQPETVLVGKVVAGAPGTIALNKRSGAKIL